MNIQSLQLPCSSSLASHSIITTNVHNFDTLGNASTQIHDNSRHSSIYEDIINKGMQNGYCELDNNGHVPSERLPLITPSDMCIEEYSNHLGTTDNFTQTITSGNGNSITNVINHSMNINGGALSYGYAGFQSKKSWTLTSSPIIINFIIQNIVFGSGNYRYGYYGLKNNFTTETPFNVVGFWQHTNNTWWTITGNNNTYTSLTVTITNGDILTIIITNSKASFYVNGLFIRNHTAVMSGITAPLKLGASISGDNPVTTPMSSSIDYMSIQKIF